MNVLFLDGGRGFAVLPSEITRSRSNATLEAWVKWESFRTWARVFDFGREGNAAVVQSERATSTVNFTIYDRGGTRHRIQAFRAVKKGTWHHIAAVCGRGGMKFYIDGKLVGKSAYTGSLSEVSEGVNYIGKSNWPSDKLFHGYICEFRIWDVSRSEGDIRKTMYTQLSGDEDHLIGYWRFDQAEDKKVQDLSGNGLEATLVGGASIFSVPGPPLAKVDPAEKQPVPLPQAVQPEPGAAPPGLSSYQMLFRTALQDRKIDASERQMLESFRSANEISEEEVRKAEWKVRKALKIGPSSQNEETYFSLLKTAYSDGKLTPGEAAMLKSMKAGFGISDEREAAIKKALPAVKPKKPAKKKAKPESGSKKPDSAPQKVTQAQSTPAARASGQPQRQQVKTSAAPKPVSGGEKRQEAVAAKLEVSSPGGGETQAQVVAQQQEPVEAESAVVPEKKNSLPSP